MSTEPLYHTIQCMVGAYIVFVHFTILAVFRSIQWVLGVDLPRPSSKSQHQAQVVLACLGLVLGQLVAIGAVLHGRKDVDVWRLESLPFVLWAAIILCLLVLIIRSTRHDDTGFIRTCDLGSLRMARFAFFSTLAVFVAVPFLIQKGAFPGMTTALPAVARVHTFTALPASAKYAAKGIEVDFPIDLRELNEKRLNELLIVVRLSLIASLSWRAVGPRLLLADGTEAENQPNTLDFDPDDLSDEPKRVFDLSFPVDPNVDRYTLRVRLLSRLPEDDQPSQNDIERFITEEINSGTERAISAVPILNPE